MQPTVILPVFPSSIEEWWWREAVQRWSEMSEDKLLNLFRQEIVKQSDRFNKFRDFDAEAYGKRDLSVLAYGNFYFSRTWTAMTFAMAEAYCFRSWNPPKKGPVRILDMGAGTGASGLSCLHYLRSRGVENHLQLEAVDYSSKSLAFLKKLHGSRNDLWTDSRVTTTRQDLKFSTSEDSRKKYDLILLGYSLNELLEEEGEDSNYGQLLSSLPDLLKSNGMAIITEPAQSDICHLLQRKCSDLVHGNQNLYLHAPYFNGMSCPLAANQSKYFSHEVRKFTPPETVEKINRPLNLEIREVKFGLTIIGTTQPRELGKENQVCRIISPLKKRKGTVSFIGMASDGNEYTYEFQRRDLQKEELNDLMAFVRGDIVEISAIDVDEKLDRIRLQKIEQIHPLFMPRLATHKNC